MVIYVNSNGEARLGEKVQDHGHSVRIDPLGGLSELRKAVTPDLQILRDLALHPGFGMLRDLNNPLKW